MFQVSQVQQVANSTGVITVTRVTIETNTESVTNITSVTTVTSVTNVTSVTVNFSSVRGHLGCYASVLTCTLTVTSGFSVSPVLTVTIGFRWYSYEASQARPTQF